MCCIDETRAHSAPSATARGALASCTHRQHARTASDADTCTLPSDTMAHDVSDADMRSALPFSPWNSSRPKPLSHCAAYPHAHHAYHCSTNSAPTQPMHVLALHPCSTIDETLSAHELDGYNSSHCLVAERSRTCLAVWPPTDSKKRNLPSCISAHSSLRRTIAVINLPVGCTRLIPPLGA